MAATTSAGGSAAGLPEGDLTQPCVRDCLVQAVVRGLALVKTLPPTLRTLREHVGAASLKHISLIAPNAFKEVG